MNASGPPEGVLSWEVSYESDDEGVVLQPSFGTPDTGLEEPRIRPDEPAWRRAFGPVRPLRAEGPSDLTVDPKIIVALAKQFVRDLEVPTLPGQPIGPNTSHASDGLLDVVRWGFKNPSS